MEPLMPMTTHQKIFSLIGGLIIFLSILELVRRRKLKEEYSWLWLLTGSIIALVVIEYELLGLISRLVGAKAETTTLFIFSILFLIIINIYYSIKISTFSDQIKNLCQKISLLEAKLKTTKKPKSKVKSKK